MRSFSYVFVGLISLAACASAPDTPPQTQAALPEGMEHIKFETTPTGGEVTLLDPSDPSYAPACTAPCGLDLDITRHLDLRVEKPGFETHMTRNLFYQDFKAGLLSDALLTRMNNGKPMRKGQRTVKIDLLTPEQRTAKDRQKAVERAQRLENQKHRDTHRKRVMADDRLTSCRSTGAADDTDAKPLIHVPPMMPLKVRKSGHCKVELNVAPDGSVTDAIATYCTEEQFKKPALHSTLRWTYVPKIHDGRPVARCGVRDTIDFVLIDDDGNPVPE